MNTGTTMAGRESLPKEANFSLSSLTNRSNPNYRIELSLSATLLLLSKSMTLSFDMVYTDFYDD